MKELKFRAWDKELNFMIDPFKYFIRLDGSIWFNLGDSEDNLIEQTFKLGLMQYTGMKDKNGKEIYEGDIVLGNDSPRSHEIVFHHGSFKENNSNLLFSTSWEIIGNIYQHSELLEE